MTPDLSFTTRREREKKGEDSKWDEKKEKGNAVEYGTIMPNNLRGIVEQDTPIPKVLASMDVRVIEYSSNNMSIV